MNPVATRVQRAVAARFECPSSASVTRTSVPLWSEWVVNECRNVCNATDDLMPVTTTAFGNR